MNRAMRQFVRGVLLLYFLALTVGTHWPRLSFPGQETVPFGLDKWLHVMGFGGFAMLIYLSRLFSNVRRTLLLGTALAIVYAIVNEFTQSLMPERSSDPYDVAASVIGITATAILFATWSVLRRPDDTYVGHARTMASFTFLSRIFGLVRDIALAFVFGFGWVFDAFVIAFMIPNLFRRLFGEGALAGAFVPHYSQLEQSNRPAAQRFATLTISALWVVLAMLSLLGVVLMFALLKWGTLGERGELTVTLTMLSIWYAPMVCVAAILGAMLQVHGRFALPAAMPIVLNVMIVVAAVVGYMNLPHDETLATPLLVIMAVLVAGIIQITMQTHVLKRLGIDTRPHRAAWADPVARDAARRMFRQWIPTVVGLAVFQINTLADSVIAMVFSGEPGRMMRLFGYVVEYPMQTGSVAVLGAAARLYEFPLGVFGIAVATAIFPALSRLADRRDDFADLIRQGLRLTIFIGLPASVGLILIRQPITATIYHHIGNIMPEDAGRIAWVLLGYAPAIWAYSMNHLLIRAFYAKHNATTPMRVSIAMVGLNVVLNFTLIWPLGAAGLAWSTSLCAMLQTVILLFLVRRYVTTPVDHTVLRSWGQTVIATLITAAVAAPLVAWLFPMTTQDGQTHWLGVVGVLALAVGGGAATFALAARKMNMAELHWILSRKAPAARAE